MAAQKAPKRHDYHYYYSRGTGGTAEGGCRKRGGAEHLLNCSNHEIRRRDIFLIVVICSETLSIKCIFSCSHFPLMELSSPICVEEERSEKLGKGLL